MTTYTISTTAEYIADNVKSGDNVIISGGTVSGITISNGVTVSLTSGATTSNVVIANGGVEDVVAAAGGGTAIGTVVRSGGTAETTSALTSITNAFTDLTVNGGGTLALLGIHYNAGNNHVSVNTATDVLTVVSGTTTGTIQLSGNYTTNGFAVVSGAGNKDSISYTCFLGGTSILTNEGEVAVESLNPGDAAIVRRDGQEVAESVVWIGSSTVDLTRHAHPELAAPIRIKAGALAENVPERDLVVSPEHCMILDGKCVPAKLLVNGGSIAQEHPTTPFQYYHVELEKHGILIAEGAEAESYLDTGNRASFENANQPRKLHPTFEVNADAERWKTDACAPLATQQVEIASIWQALADRSATMGYSVEAPVAVNDPDLHLMVDGRRIEAISDRDSRYVFPVPAGAKSVILVSRSGIPSDRMDPMIRDTRRLGVRIDWIAIRADDHETILSADHPSLQEGWHDSQKVGSAMYRWTDGAGVLPWDNVSGAAMLTVRCIASGWYPIENKASLAA